MLSFILYEYIQNDEYAANKNIHAFEVQAGEGSGRGSIMTERLLWY